MNLRVICCSKTFPCTTHVDPEIVPTSAPLDPAPLVPRSASTGHHRHHLCLCLTHTIPYPSLHLYIHSITTWIAPVCLSLVSCLVQDHTVLHLFQHQDRNHRQRSPPREGSHRKRPRRDRTASVAYGCASVVLDLRYFLPCASGHNHG
jgi:hypothetical protein